MKDSEWKPCADSETHLRVSLEGANKPDVSERPIGSEVHAGGFFSSRSIVGELTCLRIVTGRSLQPHVHEYTALDRDVVTASILDNCSDVSDAITDSEIRLRIPYIEDQPIKAVVASSPNIHQRLDACRVASLL
ncbi:hypothetical protein ABIE67_000096 [Streptomyces sp. V4I8]